MTKILFPTDYSIAAEHAFTYALGVAKHTKAELVVFHAYKISEIRGGGNLPRTMEEAYASMRAEQQKHFDNHFQHLEGLARKHQSEDVELSPLLTEGSAVHSIIRNASTLAADFIVMGTKGATGLKEIFLGSIAGEVMENASCPVLAIPNQAVFDGVIDNIAVTTSFKEEEKKSLWKTLEFAKHFNAKVTCLHVDLAHTVSISGRLDDLVAEFEQETNLEFQVIDSTDLEKALAHYIEDNNIDIVAMLTHKRSFLDELFNYSRTKKMAYHSKTPILAIQA